MALPRSSYILFIAMSTDATEVFGGFPQTSDVHELAMIVQSNSWAGVAAMSFLLWDTVVHFSDEVEYIWKGRNTWIRYLYLFMRYMPLLVQAAMTTVTRNSSHGIHLAKGTCKSWIILEVAATMAMILAVELILVIRVYALYNRSKVVLRSLCVMFIVEIGVMIMSVAKTIPKFRFTPQCMTITAPPIFMASWLSSLAFESVLFALTLVRFARIVRRDYTTGKHTFVYIFVRDGVWAFALIFVIFLVSTLMYQLDAPRASACFFWAFAILSFTGSHVLLNLRRLTSTYAPHSGGSSEHHELAFRNTPGSAVVTHQAVVVADDDPPVGGLV